MIIYAPNPVPSWKDTVFLAGTIDMGQSEDWQTRVMHSLNNSGHGITVLNPRRPDWDASWEQSIDNPKFVEQVRWELGCLENANRVLFYFAPGSKSPITLAELGLVLGSSRPWRAEVCCPPEFWRRGNVEIMTKRARNVFFWDDLDEMVDHFIRFY